MDGRTTHELKLLGYCSTFVCKRTCTSTERTIRKSKDPQFELKCCTRNTTWPSSSDFLKHRKTSFSASSTADSIRILQKRRVCHQSTCKGGSWRPRISSATHINEQQFCCAAFSAFCFCNRSLSAVYLDFADEDTTDDVTPFGEICRLGWLACVKAVDLMGCVEEVLVAPSEEYFLT
mmetsp:Transcript_68926/g.107950  ORF Transcript_68926/g.107950 Transcript_68926/m.107950 type:complete len:177 (+) Transcript_68926:70-600(+)